MPIWAMTLIDVPTQCFVHRARRRDDKIAVEESNRRRPTICRPDFRLNGAGDHFNNLLSPLFLGHSFFIFTAAAATAAENALPAPAAATAPAAAGVGLRDIEIWPHKIRDFHDQILYRVNAREHLLVGHLAGGDFD